MTWLVFLAGLGLAVAGGVAIVSGAPIIQIERGWAEVIAGSVALSGGVMTLALGVVALRLGHLRTAVIAALPRPEPIAADLALSPLRPTHGPDDDVAVTRADAWHDEARAEDQASAGGLEAQDPAILGPALDRAHEPTAAVDAAAPPVAALQPDEAAPGGAIDAPPVTLVDEAEPAPLGSPPRRLLAPSSGPASAVREDAPTAPLSRDWLSRPLLRSRGKPPAQPDLPPLFDSPADDEPAATADNVSETATTPLPFTVRPTIADPSEAGSEFDPDVQPAGPPDPAVIGRYKSGASSYTMYSDGAIDVETEGGEVHRFGSMDDLKAFIARQERELS